MSSCFRVINISISNFELSGKRWSTSWYKIPNSCCLVLSAWEKCFFFSFLCRAEYGKYSVLVGHSGARKREKMSAFREILMTEALNKVQSMDPEIFKKKVRSAQMRLLSK